MAADFGWLRRFAGRGERRAADRGSQLHARTQGFTLVEALVAIAILGIVALLAWRATTAMTDGESRLASESARWQQLDALFTRMEADMRRAVPRNVREGARVEPAWSATPEDAAGNTQLIFSRAGPDSLDEPGVAGQRIGYRWRAGRVEVLYWAQFDSPAGTEPAAYTLADGIAGFRILQLAGDDRWSNAWPVTGAAGIPRGVHVEVTLAGGEVIERWLALQ